MAFTTMMDGSGRIVIPKEIREEMRIDYGTFLVVEKENENTIRLKIVRVTNSTGADNPTDKKRETQDVHASDRNLEVEKLRKFLE